MRVSAYGASSKRFRKIPANPRLTQPQCMYHNNNQAPPPKRIGTGAEKYRRVEGKRSFSQGYRQPNNETPVCGRDDTGPRQGQVSHPPVPTRSATVPARS